jgi:hypothetical protein
MEVHWPVSQPTSFEPPYVRQAGLPAPKESGQSVDVETEKFMLLPGIDIRSSRLKPRHHIQIKLNLSNRKYNRNLFSKMRISFGRHGKPLCPHKFVLFVVVDKDDQLTCR